MIKKLLVCSIAALGLFMTGCLTDPTEATAPAITGPTTVDTLVVNTPKTVTVKIEADDAITFTYQMLNSTNTAAAGITTSPVDATPTKTESKTINFTITNTAAAAGSYKLRITATASGLTSTVDFSFVVKGTVVTPDVTTGTVTLGAHDATTGSSVDLDAGTVMLSAAAKAAGAAVDILYTYSDVLNAPVIMNPTYASVTSGITAFAGWTGASDTKFHKVTGVSFDAVNTKAAITALFNAALATSGRVQVAVGDILVVKTDLGNYVLVRIDTVSVNATGSATIKYAK